VSAVPLVVTALCPIISFYLQIIYPNESTYDCGSGTKSPTDEALDSSERQQSERSGCRAHESSAKPRCARGLPCDLKVVRNSIALYLTAFFFHCIHPSISSWRRGPHHSIEHRIPRIHYLTILANNHYPSLSFRHGILLTPRPLKVQHLASCSWDVLVFEFCARTLVLVLVIFS